MLVIYKTPLQILQKAFLAPKLLYQYNLICQYSCKEIFLHVFLDITSYVHKRQHAALLHKLQRQKRLEKSLVLCYFF